MSAERHQRIKALFLAACDLPGGEERRAFLERECRGDAELLREVEGLLGADAAGVPALARPAVAGTPAAANTASAPALGRLRPGELERLAARSRVRAYDLHEELGRGGMARVLRARDVDLARELAMKVSLRAPVHPGTCGVDIDLARFLEEARTTARLDHPGIVPVHDLGLDAEGRLFFTMKLVRGRDLGAILRAARAEEGEGAWSTTRLVGVLQKVAEAVAYAHAKGVVHRDLKPANVMVGDFGEVLVMDWGIARVIGGAGDGGGAPTGPVEDSPGVAAEGETAALTSAGSILGTPHQMPPEQARGDPVGPPADVYALGAMLYEVLAGRRPYEEPGRSAPAAAVLARILEGPPKPLAQLAPRAPAELVAIAERAMARSPEERYEHMRALADDLGAYLEGRVVRAHRTGALAELRKWIGRNRLASSGLALALVGVLGGALWSREVERRSKHELDLAADYFRARVVRDAADELWPALPATLPALADWIARAERLLARRGLHAERLRALEASPHADPTETTRQRALVAYLDGLGEEDGLLADVRRRHAFAATIEERSVRGAQAAARWHGARAAVRAHPAYGGLDLAPQLGLVPLGPDPESGLHEFVHLATGQVPARGPEGRLALGPEHGVVFVLIPGGTFHLGASREPGEPNHDPNADQNEAPVHEVALAPYLLAKHELTQAQWERVTGANPSRWPAGHDAGLTPTNPVEQVDWSDAVRVLGRMGLVLPTEARWEYACRAGTETPFAIPLEELVRHANVADQTYAERFRPTYAVEEFDDGFGYHAPVGSLAPNAFGLHDMHGNVWEWTSDFYGSHAHPRAEGDGGSLGPGPGSSEGYWSTDYRVIRGGSFELPSHFSRSSHRVNFSPTTINHGVGLRPARDLEAESP